MKKIKLDNKVQYQLIKESADEGQLSGVSIGMRIVGPAEWLDGDMLIVYRGDPRETGCEPTFIRTSSVVDVKKVMKNIWELKTRNGSTYRLSKLSIPA